MFRRQVGSRVLFEARVFVVLPVYFFFYLYFQIGTSYFHIKRPLFVLLNDLDEIRDQFSSVGKYPTWLLFLRDDTRSEDFLSDVWVPFNCVLMVAKRNTEGSGEIVRDVYRISKEDELRSMNFGTWDEEEGFRGPRLGLYQRRHDLHGRAIRVVSGSSSLSDRQGQCQQDDRHRWLLRRGDTATADGDELHVSSNEFLFEIPSALVHRLPPFHFHSFESSSQLLVLLIFSFLSQSDSLSSAFLFTPRSRISFSCLAVSLRKYSSWLAADRSSKMSRFLPSPLLRRLS